MTLQDNTWGFAKLACPHCGSELTVRGKSLHCRRGRARHEWRIRNGIVRFVEESPYWGEVPQRVMKTALEVARLRGWRVAARETLAQFQDYVESKSRADWKYELPELRDLDILDLGSGLGQISYLLAVSGHKVWSCEAVSERVEFQRLRCNQEKISDHLTLVQASVLDMPFREMCFDVVVMNGLLEWLGISRADGDPRNIQLEHLVKIRQVLRPGGLLYIGIENRFGYTAFLGSQDHSGLPFTSLMPRWMASLAQRHLGDRKYRTSLGKSEYRTYTYAPGGYRKLLREAGFKKIRLQWVMPGYNDPRISADLGGSAEIRFVLRSLLTRGSLRRKALLSVMGVLARAGFWEWFSPQLSIWAMR